MKGFGQSRAVATNAWLKVAGVFMDDKLGGPSRDVESVSSESSGSSSSGSEDSIESADFSSDESAEDEIEDSDA